MNVGEPAAFQISLMAPAFISISSLPITSLLIEFADGIDPIVVRHSDEASEEISTTRLVDLGPIAASMVSDSREPRVVQTHLRWRRGATLVLAGSVTSETPKILKVSSLESLAIISSSWTRFPGFKTSGHAARRRLAHRNTVGAVGTEARLDVETTVVKLS